MSEVVVPLKPSQVMIVKEDKTLIRCYGHQNPQYYYDENYDLNPINVSIVESSSSSIGGIYLRNKNIISVGHRNSSETYKYLGLRPSQNQTSGSEQLEWSLNSAEINGSNINLSLGQNEEIDAVTRKLGNVHIVSNRQRTSQLVEIPSSTTVTDFSITFTIHLTGLRIANTINSETGFYEQDSRGRYRIENEHGDFRFWIVRPILMDDNYDWVYDETKDYWLTDHSLKLNSDGTYEYIKKPSPDMLFNSVSLPASVKFIDSTTIYSESEDFYAGDFRNSGGNWADLRNDTSSPGGGAYMNTGTTTGQALAHKKTNGFKYIRRVYFHFDTSAVTNTPTAGTLKVYATDTDSSTNSDFVVCKSTDDGSPAEDDMDAIDFSVAYSDVITRGNSAGYKTFTLNSTAFSDIASLSLFKCGVCEEPHDKDNDEPDASSTEQKFLMTIRMSDYTGTGSDPYIEITVPVFCFLVGILSSGISSVSGITSIASRSGIEFDL